MGLAAGALLKALQVSDHPAAAAWVVWAVIEHMQVLFDLEFLLLVLHLVCAGHACQAVHLHSSVLLSNCCGSC